MKHKHHIIPQHLNSPCPIAEITIELSIEEHAEAHRKLYEEGGRWQDKVAWQALAGMIDKQELIHQVQSNSWKNRNHEEHAEAVRASRVGVKWDLQTKQKISQGLTGKVQLAETIAKRVAKTTGQKRPMTAAKVSGGNNGSAKQVMLNGIRYETIKQAMADTGLSRYNVLKQVNK